MKEKRDAFLIGLVAVFFFASAFLYDIYSGGLLDSSRTFGVSYMTMNNPFYTVIQNGLIKDIEGREDHLILRDPVLDSHRQIEQIEEFIEQDVDGIFVNPVDSNAIIPVLQKAADKGIPVVVIDSPLGYSDSVVCSISSDNYQAGVLCGHDLLNKRDSARIALLKHSDVISASDRIQGFLDTISSNPNFEIVAEAECLGQTEKAMPAMVEMLEEHPEIDVVMSLNDPSALGAIAAIDFMGREDISVYGIDGTPEFKNLLLKNKAAEATVTQSPYQMASQATKAMYDTIDGKKPQATIITPIRLLDASNITADDLGGWQ